MTQTHPPVQSTPAAQPAPANTTGQPYEYRRTPLVEPDWTRFPAGATSPATSGKTPSGSASTA